MAANATPNTPIPESHELGTNQPEGPSATAPGGNANKPKPSAVGKYLQMIGVIGAESGLGFGLGFMLGKKNMGGIIGTIVAISIVFALEFWLRYAKGNGGLLLFGGILALVAAGVVPYMAMSKAGKGKAKTQTAYLPTIAGAWALVAIVFGIVCAHMGKVSKPDALQGIILSILYAGVTSTAGFGVGSGAGKSGTTMSAIAAWVLLFMFDMAGLARAPVAANTPSAAAGGAGN